MLKKVIIFAAVAGLVLALAPAAQAVPKYTTEALTPDVLDPGDTFHLVFVTSTSRDATSALIADYNAFVAANGSTYVGVADIEWYAIGSTANKDAKDNAVVSAPVYLLDATTKVADDAADMWDGSIGTRLDLTELGTYLRDWDVMTGSAFTGTAKPGLTLGDSSGYVRVGYTDASDARWIDSWSGHPTTHVKGFYALSEELTVIPEPASAALLLIGAPLLALRRRRRS